MIQVSTAIMYLQSRSVDHDDPLRAMPTLTEWTPVSPDETEQEAQLMLTTGSTRLAVSRGQQTWYHSTCYIWFPIVQ